MRSGVPENSASTNDQDRHRPSSASAIAPAGTSSSHRYPPPSANVIVNIPALQVSPALLSATNWASTNSPIHQPPRRRRSPSPSPPKQPRPPKRQRTHPMHHPSPAQHGPSSDPPPPNALPGTANPKLESLLKSFREGLQAIGLSPLAAGPDLSPPWPAEVSDVGREEVVRLLLQGMKEIGYPAAAMTLEAESGYSLDPTTEITLLRDNILIGNWNDVEEVLKREHLESLEQVEIFRIYQQSNQPINHSQQTETGHSKTSLDIWVENSLLGVDSEVLNMARFLVSQQKYLELLEQSELKKALVVLRRDLAPLASPTTNPDLLIRMKSPVSIIDTSLNTLSVNEEGAIKSQISGIEEIGDEDPGVQRLCLLSSLMMCGSIEEIKERANWSGSGRGSRVRLLEDLQALIPPEKLLPHQRLSHLLEQAKSLQRLQCLYHVQNPPIGLLCNHSCSRFTFPTQTSHILSQHSDEVWRIEWDHLGTRLASAGKDPKCIIWKLSPVSQTSNNNKPVDGNSSRSFNMSDSNGKTNERLRGGFNLSNHHSSTSSTRTRTMLWQALSTPTPTKSTTSTSYLPTTTSSGSNIPSVGFDEEHFFGNGNGQVTVSVHKVLDGHTAGISCIAWSPDDSVILTGSDCTIKMWNTTSGECICTMVKHEYDVSALSWLPDGQGFVSGGMDSDVLFWDLKGQNTFVWKVSPSRILDLSVSPDGKRLVAIGVATTNNTTSTTRDSYNNYLNHDSSTGHHDNNNRSNEGSNNGNNNEGTSSSRNKQRRIHFFNIIEKREDAMIPHMRELTCVSISDDSKFALINQSPNEVHLYSLETNCLIRRYVGQKQGEFVIRSCFGGLDRNFILSGSEDSKIYVWHKETGSLIEVLDGHGIGSVNAVAWNPKHPSMFASASDDHTIRIWQAPGLNHPL